MNQLGIAEATNITVVSFEPNQNDRLALERIFNDSRWPVYPGLKWKLRAKTSLQSALTAILKRPIPLVICGCDAEPEAWKAMLEIFAGLPDPPLMIVTSRLADDRLWVEALNLGAYDVLAKPYDHSEVIRTFSCAWIHWQVQHGIQPGPRHFERAQSQAS